MYEKRIKEKQCICCQKTFFGKQKETNCGECKSLRGQRHTLAYSTIKQTVVCKRCGSFMEYKDTIDNGMTADIAKSKVLCLVCLENSKESLKNRTLSEEAKEKIRQSKIGAKNPNWKGGQPPKRDRDIVLLEMSLRMQQSNPMKNPETVRKVQDSIKSMGGVIHPKGREHHLWKGNRKHSFVLRARTSRWSRRILERDGFHCTRCGAGGKLEVHHLTPVRDIIDLLLEKFNKNHLEEFDINSEEWDCFASEFEKENDKVDGISLCKQCHAIVDNRRRIGNESN
jgi:hypothetical protein